MHLSTEFDYVSQLEASSKYNNPWALFSLAEYYIKENNITKATELLRIVCNMNYGYGYYVLSTITHNDEEKQQYLERASALRCPNASYELANKYYISNDISLARDMILKAEQQNVALSKINVQLMNKISLLKKALF